LLLAFGLAGAALPARSADAPGAVHEAAPLLERSRAALRRDSEESRQFAEQALAKLAERPDNDLSVLAHIQLCEYHSERSREAALRHIQAARPHLENLKRPALRAGVLACEGEIHEYAGNNAQAAALYLQAVTVAEKHRDDEFLAEALYRRGYLLGLQSEFAAGLVDLQRANALFESLGLAEQAMLPVNGIAILYNRLGDYAQARQYFEATLRKQQAAGMLREQAITQHNLSRVLENLGEWDAAQRGFEVVLAQSRELRYPRGEAYALRGLASVRNSRGAPGEALVLIERAVLIQRELPDERLRANLQVQRGIALRLLGRPSEGLAPLNEALEVFVRADSLAERAAAHQALAACYVDMGDWKSAHDQQAQFHTASDSLLRRQLDQRLTALRIQFDSAAKDKENALLTREKEAADRELAAGKRLARLQAAVIALAVLLALLAATLAWRHRRDSRAMHELAHTDELTGMPNRRRALARAAEMLAAPNAHLALMIVDIDHFKTINDEHGHLVGDDILRAVSEVLRNAVREPAALGRLGGEEFVILVPAADTASAQRLAERVVGEVRTLDLSRWLPGSRVTVSIGFTLSVPGDSVGLLLRRADEAMYRAKHGGRDRVEMVSSEGAQTVPMPA
jgi:diguanylate cyclase (GGDEF)-like protein